MIRMYARRLARLQVGAGTDIVIMGVSLPSESRINNISMDLHIWQSSLVSASQVVMFAVEGWILPVLDPDAATIYNTLWDTLVPKDTDVEVVDLDTGATDATPFYEPGEPDFSDLLEVGLRPERIYHANRLLSIASGSILTVQDNQTPFLPEWLPGSTIRIRIKKNYSVRQPSVLLFAVANPSLDDTTAVAQAAAAEAEWGQMKYIGNMLERAMLHLFGVFESGAESPWEEATALLKKHLEPDIFEEDAGDFKAAEWNVVVKSIVDHSVVGTLETSQVSTGR